MKTHQFDVLVVGAGPAGCRAAYAAAVEGVGALMLEKRPTVGVPTLCAEAMGPAGFGPDLTCRESWVASKVTGVALISPGGARIETWHPRFGYVFHRDRMIQDLAAMALEKGAALWTRSRATGASRTADGWRVSVERAGEPTEVTARILIGADGVESQVIRWSGLGGATDLKDLMICAQSRLVGTGLRPEVLEFHFGNKVAPGGYAWAFPKTDGPANVGVGIRHGVHRGSSPEERAVFYRRRFVERLFPRASSLEDHVGAVPTSSRAPKLAGDRVLLAGDAGRLTDPLSGAGIAGALRSGEDAGRAAAQEIKTGRGDNRYLEDYARQWIRRTRHYRAAHLWMRNLISPLPDEDLERVMGFLASYVRDKDPSALSAADFLRAASRHLPDLLRVGLKSMWRARSGRVDEPETQRVN